MKISVGVSNRHVHVTKEHLEILFGKSYQLEGLKPINQPGQYASKSVVTLETEKGRIDNVRILGPVRGYTQVEISKTDSYHLGINPPIRTSGDIKGSAPITLLGPCGKVFLKEGCIIANRHIHITKEQREKYGFQDELSVLVEGEKGGILHHVHLKEDKNSYFEMHIDTDDANAFFLRNGDTVKILEEEKRHFSNKEN